MILLAFRDRAWQHVATLNEDEWNPIQGFVREQRQADEPICFVPSWTVGHATDQYKFRNIEVLEHPEDAWEGREEPVSGFWVVSQFGQFDLEDVPEELYPHRQRRWLAGAEIFLFRQEPIEPWPTTLVDRLRGARCVFEGRGREIELEWGRKGFVMPRGVRGWADLSYLGCYPTEARFGGRSHLGIWFHPPPRGTALRVEWEGIELQRWLVVSGGLRDQVATRSAPPVKLQVSLDGRALKTLSFPSARGWKTHGVNLGQASKGRLGFKVWARRNHSRHFVFNGRFSDSRPAEATTKSERRDRRGAHDRGGRQGRQRGQDSEEEGEGGLAPETTTESDGDASPRSGREEEEG